MVGGGGGGGGERGRGRGEGRGGGGGGGERGEGEGEGEGRGERGRGERGGCEGHNMTLFQFCIKPQLLLQSNTSTYIVFLHTKPNHKYIINIKPF